MASKVNAQWNPNYVIQRLGLFDSVHTGIGGTQLSAAQLWSAPGPVTGTSYRYLPVTGSINGQDSWVWNGVGTTQIGLTGAGYTGSAGFQSSYPLLQNAAGRVAGISNRITGVSTDNGSNTWAWNGATTAQIGLTGPGFTGSAGYQNATVMMQNGAGHVAGISFLISGVSTNNGEAAWVWNGTTTTQIGFTGPVHTGAQGYRFSEPAWQNETGQVAGFSYRVTGLNTYNGRDAWVWNGVNTIQLGFTGGAYTGTSGYQSSVASLQNAAGQVAGYSARYTWVVTDNGGDAWVWNGTTTTQIGFTGAGYTSSFGYQKSFPLLQNSAGLVAGASARITDASLPNSYHFNGYDTWIWNGATIIQIGLTTPAHTGSEGYQNSFLWFLNTTGQVVGQSARIAGVNTSNGQDAWVWTGVTTAQIGLTGGANTGSAGYQTSHPKLRSEAGYVAGSSARVTGVSSINGQDAWFWSGGATTQIGLTGAIYTGSEGYKHSDSQFLNTAGQVAGFSRRITDVNTPNGQDAWYYSPATNSTIAIIGSVRISDNFAYSEPTILTEGGFLLGNYMYYPNGAEPGEQRAFIFRPDLGFADLGGLVAGGLNASGWRMLTMPLDSDAMAHTIIGNGWFNGHPNTNSFPFAMVGTPNTCYANCDNSTAPPILNINDFNCFLNRFAAQEAYANCDNSTVPPILNINDFNCFLNKFAAGCT